MADDDKGTDKQTGSDPDKRDDDKDRGSSERREDAGDGRRDDQRTPEPGKATEARTEAPEPRVDCPECDAPILTSKLGTHRYRAHGVERRTVAKDDDQRDKPDRKRRTPASGNGEDADKDKDKESAQASRWAEVRKSW